MIIERLDALVTRLKALRPTAVVAASPRRATNPRDALDVLVESHGFRAIGKNWRQLNKDEAGALIRRVLEHDMAYQVAEMEPEQAAALADECLDLAGAADYFTNGTFTTNGWGGHQVAPGTFETGVAWVGAERVGFLWVQDED